MELDLGPDVSEVRMTSRRAIGARGNTPRPSHFHGAPAGRSGLPRGWYLETIIVVQDIPNRRPRLAAMWITGSEGMICESCGKTIPVGHPQYEIVTNGDELRLDRDCFLRRMKELE
jgi:hypothetical protein